MPELPDLLYLQKYLLSHVTDAVIAACEIRQPIVLRSTFDQQPGELLSGRRLTTITIKGPFVVFHLAPPLEIIVNLMLAGRLQHQKQGERPGGYLCLSLVFADGSRLNLLDEKKMSKCYLVRPGDVTQVPKFAQQGIDVLSAAFTLNRFRALAQSNRRKQVRVFINDHTKLSAIGNAYADEILFEARIHPKTFVATLTTEQIEALFGAIRSVLTWGVAEVEKAAQPVHVKVREHMKVRNRKGEPCPRCGSTIRREGVRGHDVFFCPVCQPATRKHFIDWNSHGS